MSEIAKMTYDEYCKFLKSIAKSYVDTYEKITTVSEDIWNDINSSEENTYDFLKNLGVETQYNTKGEVIGYTRSNDGYTGVKGSGAGDYSNSNNIPSTTSNTRKINLPYEMKYEHDGNGNVNILGRVLPLAVTGGAFFIRPSGLEELTGRVISSKLFGTSVANSLGYDIAEGLYQYKPDIFGGINPHKIDYTDYYPMSIPLPGGFDVNLGKYFNLMMGTNPDTGKSTMYIRDDDYAAIALKLYQNGFFKTATVSTYTKQTDFNEAKMPLSIPYITIAPKETIQFHYGTYKKIELYNPTQYTFRLVGMYDNTDISNPGLSSLFVVNENPVNGHSGYECLELTTQRDDGYVNKKKVAWSRWFTETVNGVYITTTSGFNPDFSASDLGIPNVGITAVNKNVGFELFNDAVYALLYGSTSTQPLLNGVSTQTDATLPNFSNINISGSTPIADTKQYIQNHLPDVYNNRLSIPVAQPDGTTKEIIYYPVPIPQLPDTNTETTGNLGPVSGDSRQTNAIVSPGLPEVPSIPVIVNPDLPDIDVGKGIVPPIILPHGGADALFTVYNPTLKEVQQFGAWMWSGNPIEQIKKLFYNPIDAIISLHKVYITPIADKDDTIHVGYLDSKVHSMLVTKQTNLFDFGTIALPEYFGNVFDYDPFTEVSIYLPFIGIVPLNVKDIMRSSMQVIYQCDMYTGNLMAQIHVYRDGNTGGILYTYPGNCAEKLPVTANDISGKVAGAITMGVGMAQMHANNPYGIATLARGILSPKYSTQRSGDFSGNAGMLGNRAAYLIITRPQTMLADKFPAYQGKPTNYTTTVGACKGFIKCKVDHIENVPATDSELNEIDNLLQQGILV